MLDIEGAGLRDVVVVEERRVTHGRCRKGVDEAVRVGFISVRAVLRLLVLGQSGLNDWRRGRRRRRDGGLLDVPSRSITSEVSSAKHSKSSRQSGSAHFEVRGSDEGSSARGRLSDSAVSGGGGCSARFTAGFAGAADSGARFGAAGRGSCVAAAENFSTGPTAEMVFAFDRVRGSAAAGGGAAFWTGRGAGAADGGGGGAAVGGEG